MTTLIIAVTVALIAGFVIGVLFGRKNASKVETTVGVSKTVANGVTKTVSEIKEKTK